MYDCKCKCDDFRSHALGVSISSSSMPTRKNTASLQRTEEQWQRDGDALHRLGAQGYDIPILDGAAELEAKATQPIELQHGKVYGPERAKLMQEISDSAVVS